MEFGPDMRDGLDRLFRWRRDVRRFRHDPVDPELVEHLLEQAALAPSVGLSQPWRWVLVESATNRTAIRANFTAANAEALASYDEARAKSYAGLKLAGLDEAPDPIAKLRFEYQATSAKLAASLNDLAYPRPLFPAAFRVAYLKRALGHLHTAQNALAAVQKLEALDSAILKRVQDEFFAIREGVLKLMDEFRNGRE